MAASDFNSHSLQCRPACLAGLLTRKRLRSRQRFLADFKTQKWVELARIGASFPNWSRDGNYIYFHTWGSDLALYRVRVSDHKLEKIVSLKGTRLAIGVIGAWCGLAPDDSPLVLRDVGTQEIYALNLQLP